MSNLSAETSKQWNMYGRREPNRSQTEGNRGGGGGGGGEWKNLGSSMDAISFGFVATAILISMFLIMAIFEHLFKPTESSFSSNAASDRNLESQKLGDQEMVTEAAAASSKDISVLMPGQHFPTFIAQPAPLVLPIPITIPLPLPCQREGVYCWPSHQHHFTIPSF